MGAGRSKRSGKSTLLKTVSGILKPYEGSVKVNGNIAPLLELGAGFDMNLTARENIYLNGLVLGHSRQFMDEHLTRSLISQTYMSSLIHRSKIFLPV